MTQGELEKIPQPFEKQMSKLEMRIMKEIVRAIRINWFSTSTADRQIQMLIEMGRSEESIRQYVKAALEVTDKELDRIFSDELYKFYYGYSRIYKSFGMDQKPVEENQQLLALIESVRRQTSETFQNITGSMGFAIRDPSTGNLMYSPLMQFYRDTMDAAAMDMDSGSVSYDKSLSRIINTMTTSGVRWIDYESGWHNRINVAARRAVMTGFRQVQGKINEQVAEDLGTDSYEVSYHVGARPSHQIWQGRVYTYEQLQSVCGLGSVTGLHGANCYHDYNAFIPGISVRTYTDDQLDEMAANENTPKEYNGKEYTTYEALQEQRKKETAMRKTREDIKLLQEGRAEPDTIIIKQAKYQGQMQDYKRFSAELGLPEQMDRVYHDGLGRIGRGNIADIHTSRVPRSRKEAASNIFNIQPVEKGDTVTAINIYKNLNKTQIGKSVIDYIQKNNVTVDVCYNQGTIEELNMLDEYGKAVGNHIYINGLSTQNLKKIAKTLVHEEKHIELNIGGDQHAEVVCDYYAELHEKGRLTGEDIRNIIKSVKQRYPEYKWRRQ